MNGLELSRKYYEACGKPMLEENFGDLLRYIAVGFVGRGSDRYGFDDEISRDHDFEPGFCIFIPGEDIIDSRTSFRLERAYAKLPKEFEGFTRLRMSPVGGNRNGVMPTAEFYRNAVGSSDGNLTAEGWLHLPDYALAEAVNGEVFFDEYGEFSRIRESLCDMPSDIKKKRIAGNLLTMAQAGQYNYSRCFRRGEYEAAQLACSEYVTAAIKIIFLLRGRYAPYYKWSFRALRELPGGKDYATLLSAILLGDNSTPENAEKKYDTIETVAVALIDELQDAGLTEAICGDLEKHAYSVNDGITDGNIRNLHILTAV